MPLQDRLFILYYKASQDLAEFKNRLVNNPEMEKGLVISGTALGIGAAVVGVIGLGTALWGYSKVKSDISTATATAGASFLDSLLIGLGMGIIMLAQSIFGYAASFLAWVVNPEFTNRTITGDPVFTRVWASSRDIANMLIVLAFVAVGVAFTLRIEGYGTKKTLTALIILALVINFSGVFCGIIIDAANITFTYLVKQGSASGSFTAISDAISNYVKSQLTGIGVDPSMGTQTTELQPGRFLGMCIGLAVFELIAAYIFAILAILLAARYAILAVLYTVSPIAFFCYVFPATKKVWSKWWDNFIKWAFVGVFGAFFIYLAIKVMDAAGANGKTLTIYDFFVMFIFLYIGYKMSISGATAVTGAVMGLAGAAVAVASGGTALAMKGGMAALNKATRGGASNAAEKTQQGYGRALERIGLRQTGSTDTAAQEKVKKDAAGYSAAYAAAEARGDKAGMDRIGSMLTTRRGSQQAAVAMALKDNKAIMKYAPKDSKGNIDYQGLNQRIQYAETAGAKGLREELSKSNPMLAAKPSQAPAEQKEAVKQAIQKQAPAEFIKNISHEAMSSPEVFAHMTKDQVSYLMDRKNKNKVDPRKRKAFLSMATPRTDDGKRNPNGASMKTYLQGIQKTDGALFTQTKNRIAAVQKKGKIKSESQWQTEERNKAIDADAMEETVARQMKEDDLAEKEEQMYELRKKEGRLTPEEENKETDKAYDEYMAKRKAEEERIAQQFKQIDQNKKT